jgi:hypothetical protein
MADLSDIASVTLTSDGAPLSRQGFGTILLVTAQAAAANALSTYTSLSGVAADYAVNSPTYRMARAAFSQNPRPKRIKIYASTLAAAQAVKLTVTADAATELLIYKPDGTSVTVTAAAGGSVTLTGDALVTAINASSAAVTASNSSGVISITNDTNGQLFYFEPVTNLGVFLDETADPGYGTALTAALGLDSDFYAVGIDVHSQAAIAAVAAWVESNEKLYIAQSSNSAELGSGTIGAALVTGSYDRTAHLWHSKPWQYAGIAWTAARLTDPDQGQRTWAFATLAGVDVDTLTPTQEGILAGASVRTHWYSTLAGRNMVLSTNSTLPGGGFTASGEWIDTQHGADWLRVRMQEDLADFITGAGRVPYTQAGIDAVKAVVQNRMVLAERTGFLVAGSSVVTAPDLADVDAADRAGRLLRNVTATGTFASAIHKVELEIALSY